jgi:hypothetical protein
MEGFQSSLPSMSRSVKFFSGFFYFARTVASLFQQIDPVHWGQLKLEL